MDNQIQLPADVMDWIEQQISFFSVPAAKVAGKGMAVDMYHKVISELKDVELTDAIILIGDKDAEITRLKDQLAQAIKDRDDANSQNYIPSLTVQLEAVQAERRDSL